MKLRYGYLIMGAMTGCILLVSFILSLPDGRLHIVFCNVGQGDGAYIRFPDGHDMVVDGGPDNAILLCLGRHMPFWDRHIDLVAMTHPQKDHMQGLLAVLSRFSVGYFVRSDIGNTSAGYVSLIDKLQSIHVPVRYMVRGDVIGVGQTSLSFLWPSAEQIAKGKNSGISAGASGIQQNNVLGASIGDLNDYSLVFELSYGSFAAVFTGDADRQVEPRYMTDALPDTRVEVLKVPHHGGKTGMTKEFIHWVHPEAAIISVGKNNYGHPSGEAIDLLKAEGARTYRTDESGDVEVVSDGRNWAVLTGKK